MKDVLRILRDTITGPFRRWRESVVFLALFVGLTLVGNIALLRRTGLELDGLATVGTGDGAGLVFWAVGQQALMGFVPCVLGPLGWMVALGDRLDTQGTPMELPERVRRHGLLAWPANAVATVVFMAGMLFIIPGLLVALALGIVVDPGRLLLERQPTSQLATPHVMRTVLLMGVGTVLWWVGITLWGWATPAFMGSNSGVLLRMVVDAVVVLFGWFFWMHAHAPTPSTPR